MPSQNNPCVPAVVLHAQFTKAGVLLDAGEAMRLCNEIMRARSREVCGCVDYCLEAMIAGPHPRGVLCKLDMQTKERPVRTRAADDFEEIRKHMRKPPLPAPVEEVEETGHPGSSVVDYSSLPRNAEGKWPCMCGTDMAPERSRCLLSYDTLSSGYYCRGAFPREET